MSRYRLCGALLRKSSANHFPQIISVDIVDIDGGVVDIGDVERKGVLRSFFPVSIDPNTIEIDVQKLMPTAIIPAYS